jgi:hypothetical protein
MHAAANSSHRANLSQLRNDIETTFGISAPSNVAGTFLNLSLAPKLQGNWHAGLKFVAKSAVSVR